MNNGRFFVETATSTKMETSTTQKRASTDSAISVSSGSGNGAAKRFRFDSFATEFASNPTSPKTAAGVTETASDNFDNDSGIGESSYYQSTYYLYGIKVVKVT